MLKTLFLFTIPLCTFPYENIVLHKSAWQLHPYQNPDLRDYVNACKAVDGMKTELSFNGHQCTESADYQYEAEWRVDLGAVLGIHHITIYYRTGNSLWGPPNGFVYRFLGFSVYISNTTEREDGVVCFKDDYFTNVTIPAVITLNCTHHGRYVIYYNNRTSRNIPPYYSQYAYNELCEFEVYGCSTTNYYGKNCSLPCPDRCKDSRCHIDTGHCFGCKDGYQGPSCEKPCKNNTFGVKCTENCGHCLNGEQCNHVNGTCRNGCEAGYYKARCTRECPSELYGRNCLENCSKNCYMSKTCDKKNGVCDGGCVEGWKPPLCDEECDDGKFGTNCSGTCGHCHKGQSCDKETGVCPKGCNSGYEGIYCNKTCAHTYYGPNCNLTCSTSCVNQACDSRSGTCFMESEEIIEGTSAAPAIGVTIGVFLVIAIAVAIIYRRNNINICRCIILGRPTLKSSNSSSENTSHMPKTYMYVDLKESQYNDIDENVYEKIETEISLENINSYEQLLAEIPLNDIESVIIDKGKDNADGFKKELASLGHGEQFSCETGKLSVNCEKNRVQTILPYDHSRVILRRNMGTSDDYINANYISGAERKNEYIATQGPLKTTLVEFWEMVCQDQIQKIIMLTNLTEQAEVKCYQYWPNDGKTEMYGTVSVKSMKERTYAFFTKRKLEVSQEGMKTYVITQFQYTKWPENGTPDPLCLVLFHDHVINEKTNYGISPTLVHCSTGIGRTGTYIALDYLYKTGKKSGRVNVAEYVKTMRKNRMNMIENFGQYKAVFLALHEAFKAEPVLQTKEEFLDAVSPMLKKAAATSSYFKREFELLKRICQVYAVEDAKLMDKYELSEPSNVPRRGSFIKALVASTHTKENGFIITQYPSNEEAVDFLRILMDHECSSVICLDPLHVIESTISWMPLPSSEKIVPPYRVVYNSCTETDLKLSIISIQKEEGEPFNVLVAEPKSDLGLRTQNDASTLRSLVSFALRRPSNNPIAVVSIDGASLCGVFCAVLTSIEQITMDDNIDVFTTVRLLMTRRPELCSTEDEYRMIYQTIYDYLQQPSQNVYYNQ